MNIQRRIIQGATAWEPKEEIPVDGPVYRVPWWRTFDRWVLMGMVGVLGSAVGVIYVGYVLIKHFASIN